MKEAINCGETKKKSSRYQSGAFHPFEIAFCGFSGSGKTTLIEKLVGKLSLKLSIAYVKHDAHGFQMDKEGKDTFRISHAGAKGVFINHGHESAFLDNRESDKYRQPQNFSEFDMVFVEGYKESAMPKILVLDNDKKILEEYKAGRITNVLAVVGADAKLDLNVPYFQRDQIQQIEEFINNYFLNKVQSKPLNGLVLVGGKSSRMGKDKSMLAYHGETQTQYVAKLLSGFCNEVFVSVRENRPELKLPQIADKYIDIGPMGGILSAMRQDPEAAWLVMACDLPFATNETLDYLIKHRNPFRNGTAFISVEDGFPEPLCAIYEPKALLSLLWFLGIGYNCPRKVMINSRIELLNSPNINWLKNANTPEEYEMAKEVFQKGNS